LGEITIQDVIEGMNLSEPVTVTPETRLRDALQIMSSNGFSQLPVVKEDKLKGMLSYKSIVKQMELNQDFERKKGSIALLELAVRHFTDPDAKALSLDDSVFELFKVTKAEDAVVIGETGGKPRYVITNFDAVNILERLSEVFLLIEQIEDMLRSILKKQLETQGLDLSEIVQKINQNLGPAQQSYHLPRTIEKMSWDNYITFITNKESWTPLFSKMFETITSVKNYFSFVRDLRNDVFHFRKLSHTLGDSEINKLGRIKAWLKNFQ